MVMPDGAGSASGLILSTLMGAPGRGGRGGVGARVGAVVEQVRQVRLQHAAAGAGGDDHVVVADEGLDDAAGQVARGGAVAAVVGGLAAAGLRAGEFDLAAGFLKQADGGEADGGAVEVHQAGDEQGDTGFWRGHGGMLRAGRGGGYRRETGRTAANCGAVRNAAP
jgi:hypothetical protein